MKTFIVMPAYNAALTLEKTYRRIPPGSYDEILLVDDASRDGTVAIARSLRLRVIEHPKNRGYGANQKTCYTAALADGADIVVMLHPDYQYDPAIVADLTAPIRAGEADVVLASRLLGRPLRDGMPFHRWFFNRVLTCFQNLLLGQRFSEYHTGYRAFSAAALRSVPFRRNSDRFLFDNQILLQLIHAGARFTEIPVGTRYTRESSSAGFLDCVLYGLGILVLTARYVLHRRGIARCALFEPAEGEGRAGGTPPAALRRDGGG